MKKNRARGYDVPYRAAIKPSGLGKAQNGFNIPKKKPEESTEQTKPAKG